MLFLKFYRSTCNEFLTEHYLRIKPPQVKLWAQVDRYGKNNQNVTHRKCASNRFAESLGAHRCGQVRQDSARFAQVRFDSPRCGSVRRFGSPWRTSRIGSVRTFVTFWLFLLYKNDRWTKVNRKADKKQIFTLSKRHQFCLNILWGREKVKFRWTDKKSQELKNLKKTQIIYGINNETVGSWASLQVLLGPFSFSLFDRFYLNSAFEQHSPQFWYIKFFPNK